jgi:hypothetical protein
MKRNPRLLQSGRQACYAVGLLSLLLPVASARAQLPPDEVNALRNMIGNRIEATTILGGDFGVSGASISGNNDNGMTLNLQKFGGSGDVGDPKPLGNLPIGWQPRLQGMLGDLAYRNTFNNTTNVNLIGTKSEIHTFAIQFGGGARFWFNDAFSIAPTIMGMYGHSYNHFDPRNNANAAALNQEAKDEGLVGWSADTWTIRPALDFQYIYTWRRTIITLSSDPTYFHTESFYTSNPNVNVNGDSETWLNKIDVDIPLKRNLWGHELRTGGFFSRTDLMGDMKDGMNTDHIYEAHGRIVLDYLNQLWKVQWIGIGGSYLWGTSFSGFSIGADIAFRF